MLRGHGVIAKALGSGGNGVFHPPVLDQSFYPFSFLSPPGPHWHLAVCVLAGLEGAQQGNFKLSGQNVKFTHEFTQQEEGGEDRAGTPHARVLAICLSPPSSPNPPF